MVNTLRDIARWGWSWILAGFAHVDKALAYWEQRFIDYAAELERQRLIEKLEKAQTDMLEVVEELRDLEARDEYEQVIHG